MTLAELKAEVGNLTKTVEKLDNTTGELKGKVDFARGAVWMLGLGMLALGGIFWLALDAHVKAAIDDALDEVAKAKTPTFVLQLPEGSGPAVTPPTK